MPIGRHTSSSKCRLILLALLPLINFLTPAGAKATELNDTVLFFPLAELQHLLVDCSVSFGTNGRTLLLRPRV